MTLINWKSKEIYIQDEVKAGRVLDIRQEFRKVRINTLLKKLNGIDSQVSRFQEEIEISLSNIKRTEELRNMTLLKNDTVNQHGEKAIESDEVFNNVDGIFKEYDISIDTHSGKVSLVSNHKGAEVIIQGCLTGYLKRDQAHVPGAGFDYENAIKTKPSSEHMRNALFSGNIYFENLPVEVFEAPHESGQEELDLKQEDKKEDNETEEKRSKPKETVSVPELPTEDVLRNTPSGQLKPPSGASRQGRKLWNEALRNKYPESFDSGGNWIGMPDATDNSNTESTSDNSRANKAAKEKLVIEQDEVIIDDENGPHVKEDKPDMGRGRESVAGHGLLQTIGADNAILKVTDKKVAKGFFLGRFFEATDDENAGYELLSVPAKNRSEEIYIICNKERTAKFMIAGLQRNSSFEKKANDKEAFHVTELKAKYFQDDSKFVYYVRNAVTACKALGTQKKDIEEVLDKVK